MGGSGELLSASSPNSVPNVRFGKQTIYDPVILAYLNTKQ